MRRLARQLRGLLRSSPPHRRLILETAALLPVLAAALRALGFRKVQRWVETRPPRSAPLGSEAETIAAAEDAVRRLAHYAPFPVNCLLRSVVLGAVLRRRGIETELRIGVRHRDGSFEAHAWVERAGVVLNDSPDVAERYRPFRESITISSRDWR